MLCLAWLCLCKEGRDLRLGRGLYDALKELCRNLNLRAIKNECYVAIGTNPGNLPQVHNVDIQYAQSAVYSPSDFAFPHDAIIAESTPNTEMALIADLDLDKLAQLRHQGSVTNSKDRRDDLFELSWLGNIPTEDYSDL